MWGGERRTSGKALFSGFADFESSGFVSGCWRCDNMVPDGHVLLNRFSYVTTHYKQRSWLSVIMACIRFSTLICFVDFFFFLNELMLGVIVIPCTCYITVCTSCHFQITF